MLRLAVPVEPLLLLNNYLIMSPEEEVIPAIRKGKSSFNVSPFLSSAPAKWHMIDDTVKAPYLKK